MLKQTTILERGKQNPAASKETEFIDSLIKGEYKEGLLETSSGRKYHTTIERKNIFNHRRIFYERKNN